MLNDVTLGQYFPGTSFIHKLDPRIKIILLLFIIVFIFLAKNAVSMGIAVFCILIVTAITRVPVKLYFKGLKAIWFIVIFTSILNIFYIKGDPIFSFGIITVTYQGVYQSIFIALRLISMILISSALTYTTSPTDLTGAIERLLYPLSLIGVKIHELAMMMTIALRFIPTLLEETQKIMDAQKARGADMESGNLIQKIRATFPIFIPLFISSLQRAIDLAAAMESRCYNGGKGRTRMNVSHLKMCDFSALLSVGIFCIIILISNTQFSGLLRII